MSVTEPSPVDERRNTALADPTAWRAEAQARVAEAGHAQERARAAQLYLEAAALHAAHDPEPASKVLELCERALVLVPSLTAAVDLTERTLAARGDWKRVAGGLQRLARVVKDPVAEAGIHLRLAVLDLVRFGDPALSLAALERVLQLDPTSSAAAQLAFEVHASAGRKREATAALERHLAAVEARPQHVAWRIYLARAALSAGDEPRARQHVETILEGGAAAAPEAVRVLVAALREQGLTRAERELATRVLAELRVRGAAGEDLDDALSTGFEGLGQPAAAFEAAMRALGHAPDDVERLARCDRLARAASRWSELAALLQRRADAATGAERAELLAERADLLLERERDPAGAATALRAALETCPPDRALDLHARLATALGALGDAAGEAEALRPIEERAPDGELRRDAARRRARLLVALDPAAAAEHFAAALEADPDDAEARSQLEALRSSADDALARRAGEALLARARAAGHHRDVLSALESLLARTSDAAERAALERAAAQTWGTGLEQWSLAAAALERATRAVPRDAAAWKELGAVREAHLGDADAAVSAYAEALRVGGPDREALAALLRLHQAAGRPRPTVEACLALAQLAESDSERIALWRQAAQVLDEQLGDAAAAAELWTRITVLAPEDLLAQDVLDELLERLGRSDELASRLRRRVEEPGARRDPDLLLRLARAEARRGADQEAVTFAREVAGIAPTDEELRALLTELSTRPGAAGREALLVLDATLATASAHAARVQAREQRLARVDDAGERARLHAEIRGILERDLGQPELALAAAARAFSEGGATATDAEIDLARLADATGRHDRRADAYDAAAASAPAARADELRRQAARIRAERIDDPAVAIAAWERILVAAPADEEALAATQRLAVRAGDAATFDDRARRRAALRSGADAAAVLVDAAEGVERLGDPARAVSLAEAALQAAPGHAAALSLLLRLHRGAGDRAGVARVLRAQADELRREPARRAALLLERARLLEEADDRRAALEGYAEILAEDRMQRAALDGVSRLADHEDTRDAASRILEDAFRAQGDARRLAALLEARVERADPAEREPLLAEIAAFRERLGQRGEAFRARARAFRERVRPGDDLASLAELERLAGEAGAWDELAAAYEDVLGRGVVGPARHELLRRLGGIQADRLGQLDRAGETLEALAAEAPDAEVLGALVRVYRTAGAWRALAGALRRQADRAPSVAARKHLLLEVAAVLQDQLSEREGAMEAYREILSVDPDDPNALRLLGDALGAAERWDELVEVLGREADVAEGRPNLAAEAAELRFRLGRIRQQRLADTAGALTCYRAVLERVPRHPAVLAALEELMQGGGVASIDAATVLEPIYEEERQHARLVKALEVRVAAAPDSTARAALLARIAQVQSTGLRSPELAFLTAARAVREDPDSAGAIALAAGLADQAGLHDELAALLAEVADRLRDPSARLELRRRVARLTARGGDPKRIVDAWGRVLELVPDDVEALAAVADVHRKTGDFDRLAHVLRRRSTLAEDSGARIAVLAELAEVQDEHQRDPAAAMATLRRLLELDPGRREALARLDRLCVAGEKWVELADVLGRELATAEAAGDGAGALELRRRLAVLKETRLLDREGALALHEQILADHPDDASTLERVDALFQADPADARAASILQRAHAATGAWPRYAAILEVRASERPDPVERKTLFLELAEIHEARLGSPELAFIALCRAFRDDPADPAVRSDLQRLGKASGHAEELAAVYEDEFERLPPPVAGEVALSLGTLHEEHLGDTAAALSWFERARRLDPAVAARALGALDRLYRAAADHDALASVLEAEAELSSPEERATFLLRLGQLCEETLHDADRAVRAYDALLAEHPAHGAALRALERLHEAAGRLVALAENLAAQRDLASEAASRLRLTARLASTTQALGRDEEAITLWREALGLDPRHEPALAALEGLYERLARWTELAELLRARIALTADRREAARLHEKLARVLATHLGDPDRAIPAWQALLDVDPRHRGALEALRELHQARGEQDALASVHRRLIPLQEDARGVKRVRMDLADVLLASGKQGEAVEQGRRAFELEGHDLADLDRLERIFGGASAWGDQVRVLEHRATLNGEAGRIPEAIAAWTAAADLWERAIGKPEGACAALERILALDPAHRATWTRLKALQARAGDWRAYVRTCDLFTAHMVDPAERAATLREVAEIQEKRLGQPEMAFLTWCRAFTAEPGDATAAEAARRLAAQTKAWDELAAVQEQVAEEASGAAKVSLLLDLGRLRDAHLDDAEGAEAAFRSALEVDPASSAALDALTDLFTRRGKVRDLVIALERKLEAAASVEEKKATLMEMARIYEERLQDPGEAIVALKRVLELDGADTVALDVLGAIYRRQGRWADLASILARTRDLAEEDPLRLSCQLQIAALHENELADDEAAIQAYRAALAIDDRQRDALSGLERLYTKLDRCAELNGIYERQVELAVDPRERVSALLKSAAIWEEKLRDPRRAIAQNEAVLAVDPVNLTAIKSLEGLYRREREHEKLIAILQQHATITHDPREVVALDVLIGDVWWNELRRADRAEAILAHALQIDPDARPAIAALGQLHEQSGRWNLALEMLQREVALAAGSPDVVGLQARIARIQQEQLQDVTAAKVAWARALDVDPGHLPSLRALRAVAEREGDRETCLRLLVTEARYVEDDLEKARLLQEAGRIEQEERDDPDAAARLYEQALRRVPDFLPAARPLADLYVVRAEWARAEAVLDVLVEKLAQEGEVQELCRQAYRLGYVAEKLGHRAKALQWQRRAYELDATYLPALEALGAILVEEGAWDEALRIHQAILIHHREGLTDLEVVETWWRIGDLHTRVGQLDRAIHAFEKALEIDGGHERSRRSLVAALDATGDWEAAVDHRRKLLASAGPEEQRDLQVAIGTICRDHLKDPFQAADAFTAAAHLDPGDEGAVDALLALYRETRQGQKAADVLGRLLDSGAMAGNPVRAARLHRAYAEVLRDELRDEVAAARELEKALDCDPRLVEAFVELEALLSGAQKWRELEEAYVRMIQRLPKDDSAAAQRLALWRALGELYRRVLGDPEKARMAYEVVARAAPGDAAAIEAHAELAAGLGGHAEEAVAGFRKLVAIGPEPRKALSALVRVHAEQKSFDEAYSAAQVLAFLEGGATAEEGQVVTRLRRHARDTATGVLEDAHWGMILHERNRGPLAAILTLLVREASELWLQQPRDLGLSPKKDELDVEGSMLFFVNMLKYVSRTLGMPVPRLFRGSNPATRLRVLPVRPAALVTPEEMFQERPKRELWFAIGKAMTFLRPELLLAACMPHDQLDALFQAAVSLGTSRYVISADPHLVAKVRRRLENLLPDATRTQTLKLLARSYCDVQRPGDMRAYMDAAELSANRVGAVLAGELEVVRRMLETQKASVSKLREEVRIRDLASFCVSCEYAAVRRHLGLSVVVPATS